MFLQLLNKCVVLVQGSTVDLLETCHHFVSHVQCTLAAKLFSLLIWSVVMVAFC